MKEAGITKDKVGSRGQARKHNIPMAGAMAKRTLMETETNGGNTQVLRREDRQEERQEEHPEERQEERREDHQEDHQEVGTNPLRTIHIKSGSCQQRLP